MVLSWGLSCCPMQLLDWHIHLDKSLPGPLGVMGAWLHRAEIALREEIPIHQAHEETANGVHRKLEQHKVPGGEGGGPNEHTPRLFVFILSSLLKFNFVFIMSCSAQMVYFYYYYARTRGLIPIECMQGVLRCMLVCFGAQSSAQHGILLFSCRFNVTFPYVWGGRCRVKGKERK